jgi:ammonia channel protein AmtB
MAGGLFVWCFTAAQVKWRIDDVLGVWPLHGLCGVWGGIACGIFGQTALGGWARQPDQSVDRHRAWCAVALIGRIRRCTA